LPGTSENWALTYWKPLFLRVPSFPNTLAVPELRRISVRTGDAPNGYQPEDEHHRSAESAHPLETSGELGLSAHGSTLASTAATASCELCGAL